MMILRAMSVNSTIPFYDIFKRKVTEIEFVARIYGHKFGKDMFPAGVMLGGLGQVPKKILIFRYCMVASVAIPRL